MDVMDRLPDNMKNDTDPRRIHSAICAIGEAKCFTVAGAVMDG
jgi:hypothetical protein